MEKYMFSIPLTTMLIWFACHFVGDFAFQSTWMTMEKGKSWEVNFYHCATYTAVFFFFLHISPLPTPFFFVTLFLLTRWKLRFRLLVQFGLYCFFLLLL